MRTRVGSARISPDRPPLVTLIIRQSTAGIEPRRAFDYWRSTALTRVSVFPVEDVRPFEARRLLAATPSGTLFHTESGPLVVERHVQDIRRDDSDDVSLSLVLSGRGHHEQGNRGGVVETGDLGIVTLDRPFVSGAIENYEEMRLTVPRSTFLAHIGNPGEMAGRTFTGSGLSELLAGYLRSFAASIERMSDAEAAHACEGALHLVRGVTNLETSNAHPDLSKSAVRSLALAYIQRRLQDPSLDPALMSAALRISRTRIYLAFADDGGVAAAIRDARLDLVLRRLASQAWDGESIASIARASGFRDGGVFSRAFRRRYGLSARAFRHLSRTG